jgi:hypothetical protein
MSQANDNSQQSTIQLTTANAMPLGPRLQDCVSEPFAISAYLCLEIGDPRFEQPSFEVHDGSVLARVLLPSRRFGLSADLE